MGKNSELVTEIVGGEPYRYYPLGNYVVRAPDVCGGRPTFKYTRIEITGTLERLAASEAIDGIVAQAVSLRGQANSLTYMLRSHW